MKEIDKPIFISRLRVQRFKSLFDNDFKLKPLTIIIGENGTGKTNIIDSIQMALSGKIDDEYNIVSSFRNSDENIILEISFDGFMKIIDLNLINSDIARKLFIYGDNPTLRLYKNKENEYLTAINFEKNRLLIKSYSSDNISKIDYQYLPPQNRKNWYKIGSTGYFNEEIFGKLIFSNQLRIALNEYLSEKFNNLIIKFSSSRSGSNQPYNDLFSYEVTVNGSKFNNFSFSIVDFIPKFNFIDPFRYLSERNPQISEKVPLNQEQRKNSQGLISFFHYSRSYSDEKDISKILEWADKFGLKNLVNLPEEDRRTRLQYNNKKLDFNLDIKDGGLGVSRLIFIIVECILAKKNDIVLIDEPEAHLHARYQALLMDLVIESINRGVQLIIATHSEYFILRLQQRIAERIIESNKAIILETKINDKKGTIVIEHNLNSFGNYFKDPPEVIKFAQQEFQNWAKAIQNDRDAN